MVSEDNCLIESILSSRSSHLRVIYWLLFVSVAGNTSRYQALCFLSSEDPSLGSSSIISGGLKNLGPHQAPQRHRQVSFDSFAIGIESRRFRWSSQTTIAFRPQSKRILDTELYPVTSLRQLLWRLADVLIADTQWRANTNEDYALLLS